MHRASFRLALILAREARQKRESVSAIVRRVLRAHLSAEGPRALPFAALGHSGRRHTARDAEAILAREWARDRDR